MNYFVKHLAVLSVGIALWGCTEQPASEERTIYIFDESEIWVEEEGGKSAEFKLVIPTDGRYKVTIAGQGSQTVWLEDYIHNTDDRTYNVTGSLVFEGGQDTLSIDGSPLQAGEHAFRFHSSSDDPLIDYIQFERLRNHRPSPKTLTQTMSGNEWELVWSDEFDNPGLPDSTKWTHDLGNWGWGNNELQYYTDGVLENAHVKNGNLHISARKSDDGNWTSARLTTRGKVDFLYGRIEFRALIPTDRGTWSAGWLLGDSYVDEISWPYCGEIDVLECVGYEINDTTGNGLNHATCHTPKYYFKKGNQIGDQIEVDSMNTVFHTYAIEWDSTEVRAYLDDVHYFTYDKNADSLEWPFHEPQNIIINLAVGGGWGGAKGIEPTFTRADFILDYVRVYQRTKGE